MQEEDNKAEKPSTAVYYAANSCHFHKLKLIVSEKLQLK